MGSNGAAAGSDATKESVAPTRKEVRYDRQLRLWGDHGQRALGTSHVCLINATATGTEILKSLVLPGVGSFTIIDGENVSGEDAGNNFFLTKDDIGKPRGEVACALLKELNPDVKGRCIKESPEGLLETSLSVMDEFSAVIGVNLYEKTALLIGDYLWLRHIPFVVVKAYGMIGSVRVVVSESAVVESHPDNPYHDLRLDKMFPTLRTYVDSINLDSMDHQTHSHTPYLILLAKAVEKWKLKHHPDKPAAFPSTYAEKKVVKEILNEMRMPDDKGSLEEENFREGVTAANKTLHLTTTNPSLKKVFDDPYCAEPEKSPTPKFWTLVAAAKKFVDTEGVVPLPGSIPDMTASSETYVQLQNIFHAKAREDCDKMLKFCQEIQKGSGMESIRREDVQLFCRNVHSLKYVRGRSLRLELTSPLVATIKQALDESNIHMVYYILLRACERFCAEKERYPGTNGVPVELDRFDLQNRVKILGKELEFSAETMEQMKEEYTEEMCRFGATEIHPIAAFLGGIAAQETIKLITLQYVPLQNTIIFDGNTCTAAAFEF